MSATELLPCPFCGCAPEIINLSVHCNNAYCDAQPFTAGQFITEAIAAWNTRATQPQAPQGGVTEQSFKGPNKWTDEEVADGHRGLRWITVDGVQGRPTSHDVMGYLQQRGEAAYCNCDKCKAFFAAPNPETPEGKK